MALILYQPLFWACLALLAAILLAVGRARRLRWWPAWLLRVGLVGLALLALFSPRGELARPPANARQVLVIDQSASLAESERQAARQAAQEWQAGNPNRQVMAFGAQAQLVMGGPSSDAWPAVDERASNPAEALRLAGELLGAPGGEVILASDGLAPDPLAVQAEAARLAAAGQRLSIAPLQPRSAASDVAVGALIATNLWSATPFDLIAGASTRVA
jgi:hypothetical protein